MIELRDVGVKAGAFALEHISFTVPSGAYGVVVGAAGAGKTTLLEVIAGVRAPSNGHVWLAARDVTTWPPELRAVALVYQRGALFPHKSVLENIGWAANAKTDAAATVVNDLVQRFNLQSLLATPVVSLSGGERQLVALARALVRVRRCLSRGEPAVLLLDEPFSALDPRRRVQTRAIVRELHREWSLTTLHVTHDAVDARAADVAILLDAGRVVQHGTPEEMLRAPAREDVSLFLGNES